MTEASHKQCWIELDDGTQFPLTGSCSIGRTPENSLVVPLEKISRRHAVILAREDGQYWLVDFSRNGTFVNSRRVVQPQRLRNGDEIQVAAVKYLFRAEYLTEHGSQEVNIYTETKPEAISSERAWILVGDLEKFGVLCQQLPSEQVASVISTWLTDCTEVVERNGGAINNYLGDGFLACWRRPGETVGQVARAVENLRRLRAESPARFRIIVHVGEVGFGGAPSLGESMIGSAVNLTFRLEKVAAELKVDFCFTEEAYKSLKDFLPLSLLPGEFELKSYTAKYRAYTLADAVIQ